MEIGLVAYVLYASFILIWCSLSEDWAEMIFISPGVVQQWLVSRSDIIVFSLRPEGGLQPPAEARPDFLSVTPSSLQSLMDWIPPDSTLILCNHGVSSRSALRIQQGLLLRQIPHIYWLDATAQICECSPHL